jgi:glucose/arabinose dehydrogenase
MTDFTEPQCQKRCGLLRLRCAGFALLACMSLRNFATAQESTASEFGPSPALGAPEKSLMPTLHIAKAIGWPAGSKPTAASGTRVNAFALGLDHPRWLYVLPN